MAESCVFNFGELYLYLSQTKFGVKDKKSLTCRTGGQVVVQEGTLMYCIIIEF